MELKDPKEYNHATQGRRELSHYEAEYDTAKQSEAINANTDELESLTRATNDRLDTSNINTTQIKNDLAAVKTYVDGVESKLDAIAGYVDTVESKLDSLIGFVDGVENQLTTVISKLTTIAENTTPTTEE